MKKSISIILAILMCFSCFSIISFAETTDSEHITTVPEGYVGVYDIEDLYCIRNDMTANYILMNDIDLTEATAEGGDWNYGGRGWNPIGSNDVYGETEFEGIFDGNGYQITGMTINITSVPSGTGTAHLGLFASVSGTIKNLTTEGSITTNMYGQMFYAGGISALCKGTIINCTNYVSINITCTGNTSSKTPTAGGIIGTCSSSSAKIINCINAADIYTFYDYAYTSSQYAYSSGIAGYTSSNAIIENCINIGNITATGKTEYSSYNRANGIATNAITKNCYNIGDIYGRSTSCGIGYATKVTHSYNIGSVTGNSSNSFAISSEASTQCYYLENCGKSSKGATSLTDAQMKLQSMYSGWDFDTVWTMEGREDYPYPELRDVPLVLSDDKKTEITAEISIVGDGKVDSVLSADIKNLAPENATYSYEWTVGNTVVSTEETYTVAQSDVNKDIILTIKGNGDFKGKISSETLTGICVHNAEEFTYNNDATCTKNGTNTATCLLCGEEFTVEAENTIVSHTFENYVYQNDATCTNDGTSVAKCEYCDATDSKTADGTKTGHSFYEAWIIDKEATCSEEGIKSHHCKNCDAKTDETALKKLAHEHSATVTNATCSENGKIVYTCICGDTYTEIIYASGHIDNDGDTNCDSCYEPIETEENDEPECKCICHEKGIFGIVYKILVTVQRYFKVDLIGKVFKMGRLCECGEYHY